jgi:GxxExxY protein
MNRGKIIYPELSYKIVGILFKVHSELGCRYQEKYYQRAVALGFDKENIRYKREIKVDLKFNGKTIGKYILDFLVIGEKGESIIVELKTVDHFNQMDFKQILGYLKAKKVKLAIMANFRTKSLIYKRIVNSEC